MPPLREALAEAARLGFTVEQLRRKGEWAVYRPGERILEVNARRRDAHKRLLVLLRRA